MPKYQFTSDIPAIMFGLSHGPDVQIVRAGDTLDDPDGATVTLYPGDTITTPSEYPHAHLWPVEAARVTVQDLKAELTARGIEYDPKAKKADLEALLASTEE